MLLLQNKLVWSTCILLQMNIERALHRIGMPFLLVLRIYESLRNIYRGFCNSYQVHQLQLVQYYIGRYLFFLLLHIYPTMLQHSILDRNMIRKFFGIVRYHRDFRCVMLEFQFREFQLLLHPLRGDLRRFERKQIQGQGATPKVSSISF